MRRLAGSGPSLRITELGSCRPLAPAVQRFAAGGGAPSSCCSGVCTPCAARVTEGSVHPPDAMGVKAALQEQG
ncbi:2Fe-2S iron-sulfur cluster binding domain-containing protein, partial [Synechococcus sp. GreenBA-s]|nr:2Fe-2S iron-sulfur cluster binding domain-containing protein [Synechococcus sp. GreenBA-s]